MIEGPPSEESDPVVESICRSGLIQFSEACPAVTHNLMWPSLDYFEERKLVDMQELRLQKVEWLCTDVIQCLRLQMNDQETSPIVGLGKPTNVCYIEPEAVIKMITVSVTESNLICGMKFVD